MLLKLNVSSTKPFIKLRADDPTDNQDMTVIGFGDMDKSDGVVIATELQEAQLQYVDRDKCKDAHGQNMITSDMLCAQEFDKDACRGDSGGPLFIKGDAYEEDELVGTVAWGRGCADSRFPGVYSRISYFYDWIVDTGCDLSDNPPEYFLCPGTQAQPLDEVQKTTTATESPSLLSSDHPSLVPTYSPSSSASPSVAPSITSSPKSVLEFVSWKPLELLQKCQGDCDMDWDCAGDMVCFQRFNSETVPGCEDGDVPAIADFCILPADDSD